jgi:membrane protein implicated in regulation of membrane protease activity
VSGDVDLLPIWAFWLGFALLLFAAEIVTTGFFLFPFGIGAALAAVLNLAGVSGVWQWTGFLAASAVCLVFSRRIAAAFDRGPGATAGAARLVGMEGIVVETIDADQNVGTVRVDNEHWRAEPADGATIERGARVTVLELRGARVVVRKVGA